MLLIFLLQSVDYKILFVLFYLIPILKDSTAEHEQVRYLLELIRKINKGKKGEQNPDDMIFTPGVFDKALGLKQSPPKKPIIKSRNTKNMELRVHQNRLPNLLTNLLLYHHLMKMKMMKLKGITKRNNIKSVNDQPLVQILKKVMNRTPKMTQLVQEE